MDDHLPIDQKTKYSIDKLADFVARNGHKFEEMIMQKQQNNPEFSFLFGGPFHQYYKKVLLEAFDHYNIPSNEVVTRQTNDNFNINNKNEEKKSVNKEAEELNANCYDQLVYNLLENPSNKNVKNLRKFIFDSSRSMTDFTYYCSDLTQRNNENQSFSKAISYLYVLHDAAFHCFRHNNDSRYKEYYDTVMKYLSIAFNSACDVSKTPEDKYEIAKCLDMWKEYLYVNNDNEEANQMCDETGLQESEELLSSQIPYYEMPVGLMLSQIKLSDCSYEPIDPKKLIIPEPQPPTDRLIAATEAFYQTPPPHRFRDGMGWEKDGLTSFFFEKAPFLKLYKEKQKEKNLEKLRKEVEMKIEKFSNQAKESQNNIIQQVGYRFTDVSP